MTLVVQPAGAKAIITVNYGSDPTDTVGGDPNVAAAWVGYAKSKGYGIKYWEIGNEVGGNGYYGDPGWEYDLHYPFYDGTRAGQPALSPAAYGSNVVAFVNAMKAQDSTIKCGVGLSEPNAGTDTATPPYNSEVLKNCGSLVDFAIFHWYPGDGTAAALLQSPLTIPGFVSKARTQLSQLLGAHASQVEILITETGSGTVTGAPATLFCADDYLSWLENGISSVDWQELHNGFMTAGVRGMADNSPDVAFYGCQMAALLADPGDQFASVTSSSSLVAIHAVRKTNNDLAALLINRASSGSASITVNVSGMNLATSGTRYDFGAANFNRNGYPTSGPAQGTIAGIGNTTFTVTVPAYSMTLVDIPTGSGQTADFTLSATPANLTMNMGTATNSTIAINRINFTSSVALTASGLPSGVTASFNPSATTGNSSTLTLTAASGAAPGTYTVTVTGTGGGLTRTTTIGLTVNATAAIANGVYTILNRNSGLALDDYGWGSGDGANVDQWAANGQANQQWRVTNLTGGQVQITSISAGKTMELASISTANNVNVDLRTYSGASNQKWIITATSGGYYRVTPLCSPNSAMEVYKNGRSNGANVDDITYSGANAQQWSFTFLAP
ncbi:MAG: RICIN domain-containing protein [Acidobacteriales bacterium]|nr:RICIN domain-containing protein [Terriglobales bacterium]